MSNERAANPFNVVFIISDQHQARVTGCYGNSIVQTPNIDRLAEKGVRFTRAYCDSPLCAPSRASIMTGLRPHTHGALYHKKGRNPEGVPGECGIPDVETFGSAFRKNGYTTGAFGKVHVHGESRETRDLGFDERALRFYTYLYEDYVNVVGLEKKNIYIKGVSVGLEAYNHNHAPVELDDEDMFDDLVLNRSFEFLDAHQTKPFFLWVGLEKPHTPWTAPKRFHDRYKPEDMPLPETLREQEQTGAKDFLVPTFQLQPTEGISDETIQNSIAAYYANVTYMDESVGRIIDKVESLGIADKTIFVYVSDHGEMLYEHGALEKHCFYEASVHVPLIISCPALLPQGIQTDYLTALIDLLPTMLKLTDNPIPEGLEGESVVHGIFGESNPDKAVFSEFHEIFPCRMIKTEEWKYVYNHGHTEQLYDVKNDPLEVHNLASVTEFAQIKESLKQRVLNGWNVAL